MQPRRKKPWERTCQPEELHTLSLGPLSRSHGVMAPIYQVAPVCVNRSRYAEPWKRLVYPPSQ